MEKNDILTSTESNILTTDELAAKLRVHRKVILQWANKGMPHLRMNSRTVRFEWDKVQAYFERGNEK